MFTLTRTHIGIRWQTDHPDRDTARWIATTMDYLLKFGETLNGPQLASRIAQHYSLDNPKTQFACMWLRAN